MEIFIERSSKGQLVVLFQDHVYTKHETKKQNIIWKCSRGHKKCPGSMTTDMFIGNPQEGHPHNHEPNGSSFPFIMRKWMKSIRKMARSSKVMFKIHTSVKICDKKLYPTKEILSRKARSV